jgi:hypothetical protein
VSAAAAAALVATWIVLWRVRPASLPVHSGASVHADSRAVWSEHRNGNREVIEWRGLELVEVLDSHSVQQVLSDWPSGLSIEVR